MKQRQSSSPGRHAKRVATIATALLALCALGATAFASAAGASPTALCKAAEKTCAEEHLYLEGTSIEANASEFRLETEIVYGGLTFSCKEASVGMKNEGTVEEPLAMRVTSFGLTGCKAGIFGSCEAKAVGELGQTTLSLVEADRGFLETLPVTLQFKCMASGFLHTFEFTSGKAGVGTYLEGGQPANFVYEEAPGFLCTSGLGCSENPGTSLSANFSVSSPQPLHVETAAKAPPGTSLCKVAQSGSACIPANRYPSGTAIASSLEGLLVVHNSTTSDIKCKTSALNAKTTASAGEPLPLSISGWTVTNCGTNAPMNNCEVKTVGAGAKGGSLLWSGGRDGTFAIGTEAAQEVNFKCTVLGFIKINCTYDLVPEVTLEGGAPAHFAVYEDLSEEFTNQNGTCPVEGSLEATYAINTPQPVYVANDS